MFCPYINNDCKGKECIKWMPRKLLRDAGLIE